MARSGIPGRSGRSPSGPRLHARAQIRVGSGRIPHACRGFHVKIADILTRLEIEPVNSGACGAEWIDKASGDEIPSLNPATGGEIARVRMSGAGDYDRIVGE